MGHQVRESGRSPPCVPMDSCPLPRVYALTAALPRLTTSRHQTLRDTGCAGIRPQWEACKTRPQNAASALVRATAPKTSHTAAVSKSDAFWVGFWNASSVDIAPSAASPNASRTVERWYYMSQVQIRKDLCCDSSSKSGPGCSSLPCRSTSLALRRATGR